MDKKVNSALVRAMSCLGFALAMSCGGTPNDDGGKKGTVNVSVPLISAQVLTALGLTPDAQILQSELASRSLSRTIVSVDLAQFEICYADDLDHPIDSWSVDSAAKAASSGSVVETSRSAPVGEDLVILVRLYNLATSAANPEVIGASATFRVDESTPTEVDISCVPATVVTADLTQLVGPYTLAIPYVVGSDDSLTIGSDLWFEVTPTTGSALFAPLNSLGSTSSVYLFLFDREGRFVAESLPGSREYLAVSQGEKYYLCCIDTGSGDERGFTLQSTCATTDDEATINEILAQVPLFKDILPSSLLSDASAAAPASRVISAPTSLPAVSGTRFRGLTWAIDNQKNDFGPLLVSFLASQPELTLGTVIDLGSVQTQNGPMDVGEVMVQKDEKGLIEIYWSGPVLQYGPYATPAKYFVYVSVKGNTKSTIFMRSAIDLRDPNDPSTRTGTIFQSMSPDGTARGLANINGVDNWGYQEIRKIGNGKVYCAFFGKTGLHSVGYGDSARCIVRGVDDNGVYDEYYEGRKFKYIDYNYTGIDYHDSGYGWDFVSKAGQILHTDDAAVADGDGSYRDPAGAPLWWYSADATGSAPYDAAIDTRLSSLKMFDYWQSQTPVEIFVHYLPEESAASSGFSAPDMSEQKDELDRLWAQLDSDVDFSTVEKYDALGASICPLADFSKFPQ